MRLIIIIKIRFHREKKMRAQTLVLIALCIVGSQAVSITLLPMTYLELNRDGRSVWLIHQTSFTVTHSVSSLMTQTLNQVAIFRLSKQQPTLTQLRLLFRCCTTTCTQTTQITPCSTMLAHMLKCLLWTSTTWLFKCQINKLPARTWTRSSNSQPEPAHSQESTTWLSPSVLQLVPNTGQLWLTTHLMLTLYKQAFSQLLTAGIMITQASHAIPLDTTSVKLLSSHSTPTLLMRSISQKFQHMHEYWKCF